MKWLKAPRALSMDSRLMAVACGSISRNQRTTIIKGALILESVGRVSEGADEKVPLSRGFFISISHLQQLMCKGGTYHAFVD